MPTGDAYSSGHLVPSLWDLHIFFLLGPILFRTCRYFTGLCSSNIPRYFLDFASSHNRLLYKIVQKIAMVNQLFHYPTKWISMKIIFLTVAILINNKNKSSHSHSLYMGNTWHNCSMLDTNICGKLTVFLVSEFVSSRAPSFSSLVCTICKLFYLFVY